MNRTGIRKMVDQLIRWVMDIEDTLDKKEKALANTENENRHTRLKKEIALLEELVAALEEVIMKGIDV